MQRWNIVRRLWRRIRQQDRIDDLHSRVLTQRSWIEFQRNYIRMLNKRKREE